MRRLLIPIACFTLVSCVGADRKPSLSPEEVLQRTVVASRQMETARYTATGRLEWTEEGGRTASVDLRMEGVLTDFGAQSQVMVDVDARVTDPEKGDTDIDGTLELIAASDREVYLFLHALAVQPATGMFLPDRIGQFAGKWWLLPAQGGGTPSEDALTPDPRLLQAQAQVISIEEDRGLQSVRGRDAYVYDIVLDQEKLLTYLRELAAVHGGTFDEENVRAFVTKLHASGELAVDAETFVIHRFVWEFEPVSVLDRGELRARFDVQVRDHGWEMTITPPTDVLLFSPMVFLSMPPPYDLPGGGGSEALPLEEQEEMIRQLVEEGGIAYPPVSR